MQDVSFIEDENLFHQHSKSFSQYEARGNPDGPT